MYESLIIHVLFSIQVYPKLDECIKYEFTYNGLVSLILLPIPLLYKYAMLRPALLSFVLGFPIMNDPLYNHPAWKEGRAGEPVNVDHVISEIVKSNYTTTSHGPAPMTENESTEGEPKDSLKPDDFEQLETKVSSSEHLSASVNRESRTSGHDGGITPSGEVDIKNDQILDVNESTNTLRTTHEVQKVVQASVVGDIEEVKIEISEKDSEIRREECLDSNIEKVIQTQEKIIDKMDMREQLSVVETVKESKEASFYDPDCTECRTIHPDPTPSELMMYLHALSYKV